MATRSCVIIKVRPEDIGKVFKFDEKKLPKGVKLDEWLEKDSTGKIWRDETGDERSQNVKLQSAYMGIYCHWDGYVKGGVGDALKANFNGYEAAKNLVIGGFCSAIENGRIRHYANRGKPDQRLIYEKWDDIKPKQANTQVDIYKHIDCAHVYLFDETRGGWLHKEAYDHKAGFKAY